METLVESSDTQRPPGDGDYARIERAIAYLRRHAAAQPGLTDLAAQLGLSGTHLQRLFSRWAGISPKRFVQYLTVEHAKRCMAQTGDLLGLSLGAGLSGPGRLHDLFVTMEAMSPGEFRLAAAGLEVRWGRGGTPFGTAQIVYTARGVARLVFIDPTDPSDPAQALRAAWPEARLVRDDAGAASLLQRVFERPVQRAARGLSLWVAGSNFQIQVWRALLQVPFGGLLSYGQLAALAQRPGAARAVGTAVAHNPVAFLIPCHRILRESGDFGVYHWGGDRKAAICAWEAARGNPGAGSGGVPPDVDGPV